MTSENNVLDNQVVDVPDTEQISLGLPSLESLRQKKGDSIEVVAQYLRLSSAQMRALEARDWAKLPDAAYVKGFLRNYARYLNVDVAPYIAQFELTSYQHNSVGNQPFNQPQEPVKFGTEHLKHSAVSKELPSMPLNTTMNTAPMVTFETSNSSKSFYIKLAVVFMALTMAFLIAWEHETWSSQLQSLMATVSHKVKTQPVNTPAVKTVPETPAVPVLRTTEEPPAVVMANVTAVNTDTAIPLPDAQSISTAALTPMSNAATPSPTVSVIPGTRTLEFSLADKAWIKVSNANKEVLLNGEQSAGTIQTVSGVSPLKVVIGAANQVKLSVDGVPYDLSNQIKGGVASILVP